MICSNDGMDLNGNHCHCLPHRTGHVNTGEILLRRRFTVRTRFRGRGDQVLCQGIRRVQTQESLRQITRNREMIIQATSETEPVSTGALGRIPLVLQITDHDSAIRGRTELDILRTVHELLSDPCLPLVQEFTEGVWSGEEFLEPGFRDQELTPTTVLQTVGTAILLTAEPHAGREGTSTPAFDLRDQVHPPAIVTEPMSATQTTGLRDRDDLIIVAHRIQAFHFLLWILCSDVTVLVEVLFPLSGGTDTNTGTARQTDNQTEERKK